MTAAEFELWLAEEELRSHQCPSCGLEPRDMKEGLGVTKVKCPFCKTQYNKVVGASKGVIHDAEVRELKPKED